MDAAGLASIAAFDKKTGSLKWRTIVRPAGMSTAFEAVVAFSMGIEVAAISCITNKAAGLTCGTLDHKEVLANAGRPAERISDLLETILLRVG